MSVQCKTYKGARIDLQHYSGTSIVGFEIDIFEDDGSDYDLSVYDSIVIKLFQKRHGTLVETFTEEAEQILFNSPIGNTIIWNGIHDEMNIRPKFYYHECIGTYTDGTPELLFHGVSDVI